MAGRLDADQREHYLDRLCAVLDQARVQRRTLTYLEAADALAIPGPQRIHKTTQLLEILLERDAGQKRPLRAALVTSRAAHGLPGDGFFDCARRLGLLDDESPRDFHRRLLQQLFHGAGAD